MAAVRPPCPCGDSGSWYFPLCCFLRYVTRQTGLVAFGVTGAIESSISHLNSLTLELSSELSDLVGETGIGGREGEGRGE